MVGWWRCAITAARAGQREREGTAASSRTLLLITPKKRLASAKMPCPIALCLAQTGVLFGWEIQPATTAFSSHIKSAIQPAEQGMGIHPSSPAQGCSRHDIPVGGRERETLRQRRGPSKGRRPLSDNGTDEESGSRRMLEPD